MNRHVAISLAAMLLLLVRVASVSGQVDYAVTFSKSPQPGSFYSFGQSLLAADVDGDGFDDLIVGEDGATVDGLASAGRAWILYGPTFERVARLRAKEPLLLEHLAILRGAVGDVDGDGFRDVLLASPLATINGEANSGRAHIFLGPRFESDIVLNDLTAQQAQVMGDPLLTLDQDGDGADEVLVGAKNAWMVPNGTKEVWFPGEVLRFAGPNWGIPTVVDNPAPQKVSSFGASLFAANVQGDPMPEVLVGRPGQVANGDIVVLDAVSLQQIQEIDAPPSTAAYNTRGFGRIHFLGDVTGDGQDDLVVGAPSSNVSGIQGAGVLFVLTGSAWTEVAHVFLPPVVATEAFFGAEVHVDDMDLDGDPDVVVSDLGSPQTSVDDAVYLWFGPDFGRMQTLKEAAFGYAIESAVGDFDGDAAPELAVTAFEGTFSGRVYHYDRISLSADVTQIPVSAGATVTLALDLGPPWSGYAYVAGLTLSGNAPGLILGPGSYLPLQPDAITTVGLSLLGSPLLQGFVGTLDAAGRSTLVLNWPAGLGAALAGQALTIAAVAIGPDSRPAAGSSAVSLPIVP